MLMIQDGPVFLKNLVLFMGPFRAQTVYQMVAGFFRHTVIADNRFYC